MSGFGRIHHGKPRFFGAKWEEEKHPRDGGKFAPKEGAGKEEDDEPKEKKPVTFKTHEQAVSAIQKLGIGTVKIRKNVDLKLVADAHGALSDEKEAGSLMPTAFRMAVEPNKEAGYFLADSGEVFVNGSKSMWDRMYVDNLIAKRKGDPPWMESATVAGTIHHELGHLNHQAAVGEDEFWKQAGVDLVAQKRVDAPLPDEHAAIATNAVSVYAGSASTEFVAEVYSSVMQGKTYSAEVEDLYRLYGGAPVKGFGGKQ